MGKMIHLTSADGAQIAAYEATPAEGPQGAAAPVRGAVVVLQEIFGLNRHIRNVADGYAKAGYFVIAPAMFQILYEDHNQLQQQFVSFAIGQTAEYQPAISKL